MNVFRINDALLETMSRDPALDDDLLEFFRLLVKRPDCPAAQDVDKFCRLFLLNYVWIDGFPPPVPHDRSKWANRKRAFKTLLTGDP